MNSALSEVSAAGLWTTVLFPAASAGAIFVLDRRAGS